MLVRISSLVALISVVFVVLPFQLKRRHPAKLFTALLHAINSINNSNSKHAIFSNSKHAVCVEETVQL